MPARTGEQFLKGLRGPREIWVDGERVSDVVDHPKLRGAAHALAEVFDLRGFNLNAKLEIDPDFLKADDHGHHHHDHAHGEHCDHDHEHDEACGHPHHHAHDDDVKSFVYRAERPFNPAKLEDFLGAIVNIYGPRMLRYKGVLNMKGTDRKVIFQGVHQLMGSDLGPAWAADETRNSKMVFIGKNLPKDVFIAGLEQCLV